MNAPDKHTRKSKAAFVWDDPLLLNDQLSEEAAWSAPNSRKRN